MFRILNTLLLLALLSDTLAQSCTPPNTSAPAWATGTQYAAATLVTYNGKLYQCLQAHTSESNWAPAEDPALWATPTPCGVTPWNDQTLYQVGSEATYNGDTYTCIQAHESEPGWSPDQTPALWQPVGMSPPGNVGNLTMVTTPICMITNSPGFTTELVEVFGYTNVSGANVSVVFNEIIYQGDATNSKTVFAFGGVSSSLQIYVDSNELITIDTIVAADGSSAIHIHWGPLVLGANSANVILSTNQTVSGEIDGTAFSPFQVGTSQGNQTGPALAPYGNLNATLSSLQSLILNAVGTCLNSSATTNISSIPNTKMLFARQDFAQDPGHFSDPYSDGTCNFCKGLVYAGGTAAGILCAVGTCVETFGLGCAGCLAAAIVGVTAGIEACEFSDKCCPINCGPTGGPLNPPTCCESQEICLNSNTGLCCGGGQLACAGKHCCNSDQSCISQGIQQGTCCPTTPVNFVCGDFCCPKGANSCPDGVNCCSEADSCGDICCNPVNPVSNNVPSLIPPSYCANAELRLCCPQGTTAIGNVCCAPGQIVIDDICCAPGNVACNGECCLGTCSADGVCQFSTTTAQCQALGYLESCAAAYPSWECQSCTEKGCCNFTPK